MTYVNNYRQTVTMESGQFMIEQRNIGFAENDGKWIVSQLPDLYWSSIGVLTQRRPGAFLGVFENKDAVNAAIRTAHQDA